jgi:hypothetical protein
VGDDQAAVAQVLGGERERGLGVRRVVVAGQQRPADDPGSRRHDEQRDAQVVHESRGRRAVPADEDVRAIGGGEERSPRSVAGQRQRRCAQAAGGGQCGALAGVRRLGADGGDDRLGAREQLAGDGDRRTRIRRAVVADQQPGHRLMS